MMGINESLDARIKSFLDREGSIDFTLSRNRDDIWKLFLVRSALGLPIDSRYETVFSCRRSIGPYNVEGDLALNSPRGCRNCGGKNIFSGSYEEEFEKVMYGELSGYDEDNYETIVSNYSICLDCMSMDYNK